MSPTETAETTEPEAKPLSEYEQLVQKIYDHARQGETEKAENIFKALEKPCILAYEALLYAFARAGEGQAALDLLEHLPEEPLHTLCYSLAWRACVPRRPELVHVLRKRALFHVVNIPVVDLFDQYLPKLRAAVALPEHQVVDYLFDAMLRSGTAYNEIVLSLMALNYAQRQLAEKAHTIFELMNKCRIVPNTYTCNALLKAYASEMHSMRAWELFRYMRDNNIERSEVTYNTLILVFSNSNRPKSALQVFRIMKKHEILRSQITYLLMLAMAAKDIDVAVAEECWEEMKIDGVKPNIKCYNALLKVYSLAGEQEKADKLLEEMTNSGLGQTPVTSSTQLMLYVKQDKYQEAEELFNKLFPDKTNVVVCTVMMGMYQKLGLVEKAENLLRVMEGNDILPNKVTYNVLLKLYYDKKLYDKANNVFDLMKEQQLPCDVRTYTMVITGEGERGNVKRATEVYDEMKKKGIEPNIVTWKAIRSVYKQAGMIDEAWAITNEMAIARRDYELRTGAPAYS